MLLLAVRFQRDLKLLRMSGLQILKWARSRKELR
jgi:hypothetical protein